MLLVMPEVCKIHCHKRAVGTGEKRTLEVRRKLSWRACYTKDEHKKGPNKLVARTKLRKMVHCMLVGHRLRHRVVVGCMKDEYIVDWVEDTAGLRKRELDTLQRRIQAGRWVGTQVLSRQGACMTADRIDQERTPSERK